VPSATTVQDESSDIVIFRVIFPSTRADLKASVSFAMSVKRNSSAESYPVPKKLGHSAGPGYWIRSCDQVIAVETTTRENK